MTDQLLFNDWQNKYFSYGNYFDQIGVEFDKLFNQAGLYCVECS